MRKTLLVVVPALVVALAAYGGWHWWTEWRFQQSTDDAYIQSDVSLIAPTIEGTIKEVRVRDNERVEAGQILFLIDDDDFVARVKQAEATVASEEAMVATYPHRLALQAAMIEQAKAAVQMAEAEQTRAALDRSRMNSLLKSDVASRQQSETSEADHRKAEGGLARAAAARAAEEHRIGVLQSEQRQEEAKLAEARAALQLARNQLDDTIIRAPVAGVAGNRAGQTGQYVKPGTQLLSLVPLPQVYITANFKETQLTRMRPGQKAEVSVDAYPDQPIAGTVESFAPASGAQFSLLPPDNATGNFTKIVQRVPVRIALPANGPLAQLLRPGLSVTVTVDTKAERETAAGDGIVGTAEARPAAAPVTR